MSIISPRVLEDLIVERYRQEEKWGPNKDRMLTQERSLAVLTEEVGEAAEEVLEGRFDLLRSELMQVAAVAIAWIDRIDRDCGLRTTQEKPSQELTKPASNQ